MTSPCPPPPLLWSSVMTLGLWRAPPPPPEAALDERRPAAAVAGPEGPSSPALECDSQLGTNFLNILLLRPKKVCRCYTFWLFYANTWNGWRILFSLPPRDRNWTRTQFPFSYSGLYADFPFFSSHADGSNSFQRSLQHPSVLSFFSSSSFLHFRV